MRDRHRRGWSWLAALAIAGGAAGCQAADPNSPAPWIEKLGDNDQKVVIEALDALRKLKAKDALPQVVAKLKTDDGAIRERAAAALEDMGDPRAVAPLVDAVDLGSSDKTIIRGNLKIADALGTLGDKSAVPVLEKMLHTRDDLLKVHAVEALGKIKDPASVPELTAIVNDEGTAPLVVKWAIIALGDMRAQEAIPALTKALVMERQGISFFVESSYALFQIGSPAVPVLTSIIDGSGKEYLSWAESANRVPAGFVSKAAIVLADIGDPSAIPVLVKALGWKDPNDNSVYTNLVRGKVAEALGRLRARPAAAPLASSLASIDDANMRALFATALAHIDDRSVLPKMEAAVKNVKDTWTDRQETITGLALLSDAKDKALLEGVQKVETVDFAMKECMSQDSGESDDMKQLRCKKVANERVKFMADEIARLMAGEECKQDVSCWSAKLKDPNPKIRERAAYTLGKLENPAAIDALLGACKDDTTYVRRAAYIALDWLTRVDAAKPVLKNKSTVLAAQYEAEKSSAITMIVNEDLKRVVWKTQHL